MTLACVKATENSQALVPCLSMASCSSFLCYIAKLSISVNTYFFLIISGGQKARHSLTGFSVWKSPRLVSSVTQNFRLRRDSFRRQGKQLDGGAGHLSADMWMAWWALRKIRKWRSQEKTNVVTALLSHCSGTGGLREGNSNLSLLIAHWSWAALCWISFNKCSRRHLEGCVYH